MFVPNENLSSTYRDMMLDFPTPLYPKLSVWYQQEQFLYIFFANGDLKNLSLSFLYYYTLMQLKMKFKNRTKENDLFIESVCMIHNFIDWF